MKYEIRISDIHRTFEGTPDEIAVLIAKLEVIDQQAESDYATLDPNETTATSLSDEIVKFEKIRNAIGKSEHVKIKVCENLMTQNESVFENCLIVELCWSDEGRVIQEVVFIDESDKQHDFNIHHVGVQRIEIEVDEADNKGVIR